MIHEAMKQGELESAVQASEGARLMIDLRSRYSDIDPLRTGVDDYILQQLFRIRRAADKYDDPVAWKTYLTTLEYAKERLSEEAAADLEMRTHTEYYVPEYTGRDMIEMAIFLSSVWRR